MPLISSQFNLLGGGQPGDWQRVNSNDPKAPRLHPGAVLRKYTLNADIRNGRLNFWYQPAEPPPGTAKTPDGPLDMRVVDPENKIELSLATDKIDWYFAREDGIVMVGKSSAEPDPLMKYKDVEFDGPEDQPCRKIWFYASRNDDVGGGGRMANIDRITVKIVLVQGLGIAHTGMLDLYIDPGIKNPGDDY